jgi:hypothetical protein
MTRIKKGGKKRRWSEGVPARHEKVGSGSKQKEAR